MIWNGVRALILPTALTVTSFSVVMACGSEDEPKQKTIALLPCADVPAASCQKCKADDGSVKCGGSSDCYLDPGDNNCHTSVS